VLIVRLPSNHKLSFVLFLFEHKSVVDVLGDDELFIVFGVLLDLETRHVLSSSSSSHRLRLGLVLGIGDFDFFAVLFSLK
jgi:hypothetical protein